jgi:integrase
VKLSAGGSTPGAAAAVALTAGDVLPEVTSHSFRKTVATLIDDSGLSARIVPTSLGTHGRR